MNPTITIEKDDPRYNEVLNMVNNTDDGDLIIVARSEINRKADRIPYIGYLNGIYFYVAMDLGNGAYAFPSSGFSFEQIAAARYNTIKRARIQVAPSIEDIIDDLDDEMEMNFLGKNLKTIDEFTGTDTMTILSNEDNANGAGILWCTEYLAELKAKIGNFYILPSSIHEVLIMPDDGSMDKDYLTAMVREVNATQVMDCDILGDRAYSVDEWL